MNPYAGQRVLVMGLGRFGGGVSVCRFLAARGARITLTDNKNAEQLAGSLEQLSGVDYVDHLGGHINEDFTVAQHDLLVVNPAVTFDHPLLQQARDDGLTITTEMQLFFSHCPCPIIAVTGSNGKSTTTAMIAAVLSDHLGGKIWLGGNIGHRPLLDQLDAIGRDDLAVLELSSFQLYYLGLAGKSPAVAVVTNLQSNHLDWHGTMDHYRHAKQAIIRHQGPDDLAVLNGDDAALNDWGQCTQSRVVRYHERDIPAAVQLKVPGGHNRSNAAAALAVAKHFDIRHAAALESLGKFMALEHRLEFVSTVDAVDYYNDSIATTPESVMAAMAAFAQNKVLILGGYDKKLDLSPLCRTIKADSSVTAVVLIGQTAPLLAGLLGNDGPVVVLCDSLEQTVAQAKRLSTPGGVVLLSPGCASYDMFENFEHRGGLFKRIVMNMADVKPEIAR